MEKFSAFKKKVSNIDLSKMNDKYTFRISIIENLRLLLLITIVVFEIFYLFDYIKKSNIFVLSILLLISLYIMYSIYQIAKYRIVITRDKIITDKYNIEILNIKSLRLMKIKNLNHLEIVTSDHKRYIIKLDLTKKYLFVALIVKLSGVELV